jgi:splicing factor 1
VDSKFSTFSPLLLLPLFLNHNCSSLSLIRTFSFITLIMAWRNQGITGSNNIPLGTRRRFGGDDENGGTSSNNDSSYNPSEPSAGISDLKRGRSPARGPDGEKRRKKRNRWGEEANKAAGLMGLPTAIRANMTSEQLEAYTLHLRIEEISQNLRIGEFVPADGDRSPSPAPTYDNFGRRVNTREYRYRKRLEEERHKLIEKAMKIIPNYHPPSDYRRPTKTQEKVYVPVNDYPEINFSEITNPLTPINTPPGPWPTGDARFSLITSAGTWSTRCTNLLNLWCRRALLLLRLWFSAFSFDISLQILTQRVSLFY